MKYIYDFLKYLIWGNVLLVVGKTGYDFCTFKSHPDIYAYYSAPWYTGALVYGVFCSAVIIICLIARKIVFRKIKKNAETIVTEEIDSKGKEI